MCLRRSEGFLPLAYATIGPAESMLKGACVADQTKMVVLSIVGAVCAVLFCVAALFFPLGSTQIGAHTVAATVNGTEIYEGDVTSSIEQQRKGMGLEDAGEWKRYLQDSGLTPEDVRKQTIDSIAAPELIKQGASELGITVDEAAVDEYISLVKASAENDEEWRKALEEAGFTEESFRRAVSDMFLEQEVRDHFRATEASGASADSSSSEGGQPQEQAADDAYSEWLQGLWSKADIVINDMPANVPYYVTM